jgi:hypothetical protein
LILEVKFQTSIISLKEKYSGKKHTLKRDNGMA